MTQLVEFGKDGLRVKGEKVIPMCAAFHYWRVDPKWWDDILGRLIKNAEMTMVASYIPWSFHEKIRGDFDFTGRRDPKANLKDFLYEGGRIIQPDDYTVVGSKDYGHLAQEPFWLYSKRLIDTDTTFGVVDVRTDLSRYSILIYAAPPFMDTEMQKKLVDYVKTGGRLLFLSPSPQLDVEKQPCTLLMDGLGIEQGEPMDAEVNLEIGDKSLSIRVFERYEAPNAEPVLSAAAAKCPAGTHPATPTMP